MRQTILQLDFADLDERFGVCVPRNIFDYLLRVRRKARLKSWNRVKEQMTSCYVGWN